MTDIRVFDNVLGEERRDRIWQFLNKPNAIWHHGAYSSSNPEMPRYFYKHFAGFRKTGLEDLTPADILGQLVQDAPILHEIWSHFTKKLLIGQTLSRCYANALPVGVGGGVHQDSPNREHLTVIYYPQPSWSHDEGGETLFFNRSVSEVIKAVVPKPDRLVVFPGVIPHVARPVYGVSKAPRITLMYKTLGRAKR